MDMKKAALAFAKAGWPIFPITPDDKKPPLIDGWQMHATTNLKKVEAWWTTYPEANIGYHVGAHQRMAVDYDPGAAEGFPIEGMEPTSLVVRSPRGGSHEYYALGEGENASNSVGKLAHKVDIRGAHGYTLLPPSTVNGKPYVWECETDSDGIPLAEPRYRSDELLRACNQYHEKHKERDEWIIEPDMPENVQAAIDWLHGEPYRGRVREIATQGDGGDDTLYRTACMMHSFGVSHENARDLLLEHYNPQCLPPWGEDELDSADHGFLTKIRNAYEGYHTSPPGNCTSAYWDERNRRIFSKFKSEAAPVTIEVPTHGRFTLTNPYEQDMLPDGEWLIEDLIEREAYGTMFGKPESFKSFLALDMALAIAAGPHAKSVWTPRVQTYGPVLYIAGEGTKGLARRRRVWEAQHFGGFRVPLDRFLILDPVPSVFEDDEKLGELMKWLHGFYPDGILLTIWDTVGRAMQGSSDSDQEAVSRFTRLTEIWKDGFGSASLALAHTSKSDDSSERGSGIFEGDPDVRLRVHRLGTSMQTILDMKKQKDRPKWEQERLYTLAAFDDTKGGDVNSLTVMSEEPYAKQIKNTARDEERTDKAVRLQIRAKVKEILGSLAGPVAWTKTNLAALTANETSANTKTVMRELNRWLDEEDSLVQRQYSRSVKTQTVNHKGPGFKCLKWEDD